MDYSLHWVVEWVNVGQCSIYIYIYIGYGICRGSDSNSGETHHLHLSHHG